MDEFEKSKFEDLEKMLHKRRIISIVKEIKKPSTSGLDSDILDTVSLDEYFEICVMMNSKIKIAKGVLEMILDKTTNNKDREHIKMCIRLLKSDDFEWEDEKKGDV